MGKINPLVAIGIPTWGRVSIEWSRAYRHLGGPLGATCIELEPVVGKPIAEARNLLMQQAIASKAEFLFMLGDDVLAPGSILGSMLARMRNRPDIHLLTGVYWTKSWPTVPYLWRGMQRGPYLDWKRGEFFEVDYAGCDALMIRLSPEIVELGPDWFSTDWLWEPEQEAPSDIATEDFYFYTKTRRAGLKLWCDSGLQCLHEDRGGAGLFGLLEEMPQNGGDGVNPPLPKQDHSDGIVRLADLGCGRDAPFFGFPSQVRVDRFDGDETVRPTYRCDLRSLPVEDQSYDLVHSRHVLEHFGRGELVSVLREWTRILRVGGEFRISVPNLLSAIDWIRRMDAEECPPHPYPWWQLYGEQKDERDFHRNGFTARRLRLSLEMLGIFDNIIVEEGDEGQNLYARATKVRHPKRLALTPEWQAIATREGIVMNGLALPDESPVVAPPEPRERPGPPESYGEPLAAQRPFLGLTRSELPADAPPVGGAIPGEADSPSASPGSPPEFVAGDVGCTVRLDPSR